MGMVVRETERGGEERGSRGFAGGIVAVGEVEYSTAISTHSGIVRESLIPIQGVEVLARIIYGGGYASELRLGGEYGPRRRSYPAVACRNGHRKGTVEYLQLPDCTLDLSRHFTSEDSGHRACSTEQSHRREGKHRNEFKLR